MGSRPDAPVQSNVWMPQMPQNGPGATARQSWDAFQSPPPVAPQPVLLTQQSSLLTVSLLLAPGCLAERWSGKKGDTAALGGKKSKKKSGRAKASGGGSGGSKQRKELGGLEGDPSPEEDEGIQKASPLTRGAPEEL